MQIETNNLVKVSQCNVYARVSITISTAQKMKFSIKDFFKWKISFFVQLKHWRAIEINGRFNDQKNDVFTR